MKNIKVGHGIHLIEEDFGLRLPQSPLMSKKFVTWNNSIDLTTMVIVMMQAEIIVVVNNPISLVVLDESIEFPIQYPSGCLLGCVLVQDCLPQEEYRKVHPTGESDSPFVFICSEPQELPIRFPIKGMHKICK